MTYAEVLRNICPASWLSELDGNILEEGQKRILDVWCSLLWDLKYVCEEDESNVAQEIIAKSIQLNEAWIGATPRTRRKLLEECNKAMDRTLIQNGFRVQFDPETKRYMVISMKLDEIEKYVRSL